jgi:catechol 2,3-dioxygenase-like lactoylglutathione lyase family enzyme
VFDHVTIRVSDLETSRRFYELALATLGFAEPTSDGHFFEWHDFSISQMGNDRPVAALDPRLADAVIAGECDAPVVASRRAQQADKRIAAPKGVRLTAPFDIYPAKPQL